MLIKHGKAIFLLMYGCGGVRLCELWMKSIKSVIRGTNLPCVVICFKKTR